MRNGFINLLVSLLLFYSLTFSFTSRSIKVKVRFFSLFILFYTSHPCVYSLSDFSLLPLVFPLSPQLPCLVISNNHLNSLTAERSLLSSSRKQDTDLSVRRRLKYSWAPAQVRHGHKSQFFLRYQITPIINKVHSCLMCLFSFGFQQRFFRGKTQFPLVYISTLLGSTGKLNI